MANGNTKTPLEPMQNVLASKPMTYIGGKPSPSFKGGKRMKPSGSTPSAAASDSVPNNPSLPIPGPKTRTVNPQSDIIFNK